jgi:hypothetical protein|tara:strand:+ start:43 stop:291 length:249 start_codon:yes stop_codon:yes gene_type:complete
MVGKAMQIKAGDLVRLHPEFRHTSPIEGNLYDAVGLGIVVKTKDKETPPVTYVKEYHVFWHESGEKTINAYASLVRLTGEER